MSPSTEDAGGAEQRTARARSLVRLSPLPAVCLGVALFFLGAPVADAFLVPVVLVVLPALAIAQALLLRSVEIRRLPAYLSSVVAMAVLAGACTAAGVGRAGWSGVGVRPMAMESFLGWTALLTALGLAVLAAFRVGSGWLGMAEHPFLRRLLPRSSVERVAFLGVSLSAGIGEELVFRGYTIGALVPFVGTTAAVLLSTVAFGVVHAYQGPLGFLRTAALGGILAWGYLASGSVLPAMAAHTLLDVLAGIVLAERLMVPEPESRV